VLKLIWNIGYLILALPGIVWRAIQSFMGSWWAARYH
jgi:hypothetical protein